MHGYAPGNRYRLAGPCGGAGVVDATTVRRYEARVGGHGIGDRDPRRGGVADVANGDRVIDVAPWPNRDASVGLRDHKCRHRGRAIFQLPCTATVGASADESVI